MSADKILNLNELSPAIRNIEYAVRGRTVIRANEIEKELNKVLNTFIIMKKTLIYSTIGN